MSKKEKVETKQFQAEVNQVLKLMINSLYSNKEIFIRELVSNAADACDRLRFKALKNDSLYGDDPELRIRISIDKENNTLMISDNGVGMNKAEVIANIGTIANSGTRKFLDSLSGDQKQDANMIGQFGVGFYSSFIVAEKVTLITRKAGNKGNKAVEWASNGEGEYTLTDTTKFDRGTDVILHLRKEEAEFLESFRIRNLVGKYSDHIGLPIEMHKTVAPSDDEKGAAKDVLPEWETVNQASALWTLAKSEIKDEDYQSFYKHISHDFSDALSWAHNRVEGNQSYISLYYLPTKAPFDMYMNREERQGLKLYVKRVFIMDAAENLLPAYLRFVKGVVDSDDLPLNVSRELLQENELVKKMRAAGVKRVLDMLSKLAKKDKEKYLDFWGEFGQVLKEGPAEDFANREKIVGLMRFASTAGDSDKQNVSIAEYLERMPEGQEKIYFLTADSWAAANNSPHLEVFRKKNIEVLLMFDRVDEWMMGHLQDFEGKSFQSVAKGDLDLGGVEDDKEKEKQAAEDKQSEALIKRVEKALGELVKEVRVSHRLTDSPSCLVLAENDMAVHMQKLLQQAGHEMPESKATLEINTEHALILKMEKEKNKDRFSDWAHLIFEQALLSEGGQLQDPSAFVKRMNGMLMAGKK